MHNVTRSEVATAAEDVMRGKLPAHPMTTDDAAMEPAELLSRCTAAARMALTGKQWTPDDRADCAGHILLETLSKVDGAGAAESTWHLPADVASFRRLVNLAANYRRSVEASRRRDDDDAAERGLHDAGEDPALAALLRPVSPTSDDAHRAAREMLGTLGVPRLGKLYPVAYTAAREYIAREAQTDETGRETGRAVLVKRAADTAAAAAELGMTPAALRKAQSVERIARNLPSVSYRGAAEHGALLGLEVPASPARKASATRTRSADIGDRANGWRTRPEAPAPVSCRTGERRTDITPPAWTSTLPRTTAARLETAARMRAERAAAKDAAKRAADRAAAGLPASL